MKAWIEGRRTRRSLLRRGIVLAALTAFAVAIMGSTQTASATGCGQPDHIMFTQQPSNAQVAPATISPAVTVTVYDSCGGVVKNAKDPVTLSLNSPDTADAGGVGAVLGGATSTPSNGVATFSNLTVDTSGSGYTLTASDTGAGVPSVSSTAFSVFDKLVGDCTHGCSGSASNLSTQVSVSVPKSGSSFLGVGLSGAGVTVTCTFADGTTLSEPSLGSVFNVVPPGGHTNADITVTLTINKFYLGVNGVSTIKVCKAAAPAGTYSQLKKCPKGTPTQWCISKQSANNAGDAVIVMMANSSDPVGGGVG